MTTRPQIYLHIGTHKTGTSSIQNALRNAAERLAAEHTLFPITGRPPNQAGQHMLAWAVVKSKAHKLSSPPPDVWGEVLKEISQQRPTKVIISAEAFGIANEDEIRVLKDKLSDFDVFVILYLRDPFAYMESLYKQVVKTGSCFASFGQYVQESVHRCDYASIVERWERNFGEGRVMVRHFEEARKKGLLHDFACVVDLESGVLEEGMRVNVSPSIGVTRAVRYLNLVEHVLSRFPIIKASGKRRKLFHKVRRGLLRRDKQIHALLSLGGLVANKTLYSRKDRAWLQQAMSEFDTVLVNAHA